MCCMPVFAPRMLTFIRPESKKSELGRQGRRDEVLGKMMGPLPLSCYALPGTTFSLLFFKGRKGNVGNLLP